MNAPHSPSLLSQVPLAPADPILGITEAFLADSNPRKVNLGVGVYTDDAGKVPLLESVRRAEAERLKAAPPRNYLPIDGLAAYDRAVQELVFGKDFLAVKEKRVVTVQALGGTGGLKIGADFLKRISPNEPWRVVRTRLRMQGIVPGPTETGQPSGHFTGTTGVTVYRGDALPQENRGTIFVGEVANNLVYHAKLEPNGVGFITISESYRSAMRGQSVSS